MRLQPVLVAVVVVLLIGCSSDDAGRVDPAGFVSFGQSDAPAGCGPDEVGSLVIGFFEAFNAGDVATRVDEFIAPASSFAWFSVQGEGERINDDSRDRASLGSYLQQRADVGEKLRLVAMDTEYERARNVTHIAYNVERHAPDSPDGAPIVVGKGAIDCESGKIMVWSMGTYHGVVSQSPAACCGVLGLLGGPCPRGDR